MTEQEIIERLKANKEMGTIYFLLPEPVKDYLLKHKEEKDRFLVFDQAFKEWKLNKDGISCLDTFLYALSDFKPHWEEFVVEDGGFFLAEGSNYLWWQWCRFLEKNDDKYNAFGGWLHPDDDDWCMTPMCYIDNQLCTYCNRDKTTKPAIPIKIRFWRFKE